MREISPLLYLQKLSQTPGKQPPPFSAIRNTVMEKLEKHE